MFGRSLLLVTPVLLVLLRTCESKPMVDDEASTLQLVHVIFRHGDRTYDPVTFYPNDPHINVTYYPYGLGELTNKGKRKQFRLGKALRERYDRFLGRTYTPDLVEALSSGVNRTKTSLELVLAGLFPPTEELIFETGLNWQPIPYSSLPQDQDPLFWGILCPNHKRQYRDYAMSSEFQEEFYKNWEVMEYIKQHSGLNITGYLDLFYLYTCLETQEEFGLELPEWTYAIYPYPLEDFAIQMYHTFTSNTDMMRIAGGYMLKKILDDSRGRATDTLTPKQRKIFLYSGHEVNVAFTLKLLGAFEDHIPPYGSYVLFELHKLDDVFGFKIYYQDYSSREPQIVQLPGCGWETFCPLERFEELVTEYLPSEGECRETIKKA